MPPQTMNLSFLTAIEEQMLARSQIWFAQNFWAQIGDAGAPAFDPALRPVGKLLILCMTPRSGSTALSQALSASRKMGQSGERLGVGPLKAVIGSAAPRSMAELLTAVIDGARTPNGVAQIKCDLPQLLPFLVDAECLALLSAAQFVYLTREDVLGQAISRYRGFVTGHWHSRSGQGESLSPIASQEVAYDFAGIRAQVDRLVQMMAAYERLFASLGLQPLRISYEQVIADSHAVMVRIANSMGVQLGEKVSLQDSGHTKTGTENNEALRARYVADCRAALGVTKPPA